MLTTYVSPRCPNAIREYRRKRHLRLKDMALLLDYRSPAHIAHWEKGRKVPCLNNLLKLSAVLGCSIEVLYSDMFKAVRTEIHAARQKHGIYERYD